jgi:hypothetical protein
MGQSPAADRHVNIYIHREGGWERERLNLKKEKEMVSTYIRKKIHFCSSRL